MANGWPGAAWRKATACASISKAAGNQRQAQAGRCFTLAGHFSGRERRPQRGEPRGDDVKGARIPDRVGRACRQQQLSERQDAPSHYENRLFACARTSAGGPAAATTACLAGSGGADGAGGRAGRGRNPHRCAGPRPPAVPLGPPGPIRRAQLAMDQGHDADGRRADGPDRPAPRGPGSGGAIPKRQYRPPHRDRRGVQRRQSTALATAAATRPVRPAQPRARRHQRQSPGARRYAASDPGPAAQQPPGQPPVARQYRPHRRPCRPQGSARQRF